MKEAYIAHRRRRLLLAALAASLVANAFLVGMLVSGHLAPERPRSGLLRLETGAIAERLPEPHRARVREEVRLLLPELREEWARLRAIRAEINRLLAAPEPDPAAVDERLAEVRAITASIQARVQTQVVASVLALPPEARRELAGE